MAFGLFELLFVLAVLAAVVGYRMKDPKERKRWVASGLVVVLLIVVFGGVFGFAPILSAGPAPGAPIAGGLWDGEIDEADGDTDTDRTETELESVDGHSLLWVLTDANMDGLGDIGVEIDMYNLNDGETTEIWKGEVSIVSYPNVISGGLSTPLANYTADGRRFAVTYAEGTTFTAGDVIQSFDTAFFTATSKASESVLITQTIAPTVADDIAGGANVQFVYNVGGIIITLTLQEG